MEFLIYRPLILFIIEFILAIIVFWKAKNLKKTIGTFLILLGGYQLGEFLFFVSDHNRIWLSFSLFCTTALIPFGLRMIENLSGKKALSNVFFVVSFALGGLYFVMPQFIPETTECNCFLKYDSSTLSGNNKLYFEGWGFFYFLSMGYSMAILGYYIYKKYGDIKNMKLLLIGYASFFPFSFLITKLTTNGDWRMVASIMCTLAIFQAFITAYISINPNKNIEEK